MKAPVGAPQRPQKPPITHRKPTKRLRGNKGKWVK